MAIYILYSILVLLLLILLLVTGIKFSQLNREISEVKVYLQTTSNARKASLSPSGSCYLLSTTRISWSKAEAQCISQRGHLLVLNSVEEDYISNIVEIDHNYWIGLVERHLEGQWTWVDGTDFHSTPTFWDKGQPDNWDLRENGEDCGQLHATHSQRKMWNDADCDLECRYICETQA
ncbi:LOW QUALITY PROTEIN: hepatic lectin-like [Xenentodon cancila]